MVIDNRQNEAITIRFIVNRYDRHWVLQISQSPQFEDPRFLRCNELHQATQIGPQRWYFALIDFPGRWEDLRIVTTTRTGVAAGEVDTDEIRSEFVADVTALATVWSDKDDKELIGILPERAMSPADSDAVRERAGGCALVGRFSQTVVMVRAMLIHEVNQLAIGAGGRIDPPLTSLVSPAIAGAAWVRTMQCSGDAVAVQIDRGAARRFGYGRRYDNRPAVEVFQPWPKRLPMQGPALVRRVQGRGRVRRGRPCTRTFNRHSRINF
jgi:hypothetical protein